MPRLTWPHDASPLDPAIGSLVDDESALGVLGIILIVILVLILFGFIGFSIR